jgi:NAD(P)-dependent dehydrogenase (short-subunit alcohol dehydrogenase family)
MQRWCWRRGAARREDLLDELANECSVEGGDALAVPTDVSKRSEVEHLCAAALEAFGRIDVWINNAGVGALGRFERVPLDLHEQVIAIVRIARDPEDKQIVGADGVAKLVMANVLPRVSEKMGARQMHKTQMEKPPPAGDSPGAVRAPMREGTGVSAGRRD